MAERKTRKVRAFFAVRSRDGYVRIDIDEAKFTDAHNDLIHRTSMFFVEGLKNIDAFTTDSARGVIDA